MTLVTYWSIVVKRWKLIVTCLVVVGLGTYIGSKLITPLYQSAVIMRVTIRATSSNSNSADYNNLLASDQLVQTEAQLAVSGSVLSEVASHFPGLTVSQLANEVSQAAKLNTQLFEVDVQDPSPARAAAIANDIAATLIKQEIQSVQQDNVQSRQQLQQEMDVTHKSIDTLNAKITALQDQVASLQSQSGMQGKVAGLQTKIGNLQNQLNVQQTNFNQWQTMLTQIVISEGQSNDFLRVAQAAQVTSSPVKPQILLNSAVGTAAGLFLGLVLAVLVELLDTRVHSPEEIAQLLKMPLLGTVWRVGSSREEQHDLMNPDGRNINVESYRFLRTNIQFSSVSKPVGSLIVTSALPNDGKSTISVNLAIFMAKAGKKTLLIDADLRNPTVHEKFFLPADNKGLSNALVALSQYEFVPSTLNPSGFSLEPYASPVNIPNLRVIVAGQLPPNPPELLGSRAMDNFLSVAKNSGVDIVIIDSPPLLGLSDTSILTAKVDGTVVVADITRVKKKNLQQVKSTLAQTNTRVIGCIVNKQKRPRKNTIYGYEYYNRPNEEEKEKTTNQADPAAMPTVLTPAQHGKRPN